MYPNENPPTLETLFFFSGKLYSVSSMDASQSYETHEDFSSLMSKAYATAEAIPPPKVTIENHVGYVRIPIGLAGPLKIQGCSSTNGTFIAPLATTESTLVASCSRGAKAFNSCGGLKFKVLKEGMSRAPVFSFSDPGQAIAFAERVPSLSTQFAADAEKTSRFAKLQNLTPHVIGSHVHLKFEFFCGDASGQNMVSIATQAACDAFLATDLAATLGVCDFTIEGEMASDKKASRGNVNAPRGVQVMAWGELTNEVCEKVLKVRAEQLYDVLRGAKDAQIRNGQFGSNINTANIVAAMFIACGQDAASVAESCWSHLTIDMDRQTGNLKVSVFFPSLPVGTVGGGTAYPGQKASLRLLNCTGPGSKYRLAGLVACFAMALDISTLAAVRSGGFTASHEKFARGGIAKSEL